LSLLKKKFILSDIMFGKILAFYTKYFAVWVVVFGAAAYLWPKPFAAMKGGMDWFFAATMFGIGAALEPEDFKRIVRKPAIVLIGMCVQYAIVPLAAYVIVKAFGLEPAIAVGVILTASAPGAMSSSVMNYIAKADVAYSVSLTTVSTLLAPVVTPGLTYILAKSVLPVPFWPMLIDVLWMVIGPLLIGFGVRCYFKGKIERVLAVFPAISATFIIFICSLVIALNKEYLAKMTGVILAVGLVLNIFGMVAGYAVAWIFRMDVRQRRTLSIEGGMQNAGLGTVLALEHLGERAAMPAAIFVFVCIITASIMAAVWQRRPGKSN
jgi:BASS family bile acid:Na+ symporter